MGTMSRSATARWVATPGRSDMAGVLPGGLGLRIEDGTRSRRTYATCPYRRTLLRAHAVALAARRYVSFLCRNPRVLTALRVSPHGAWGALREIMLARLLRRSLSRPRDRFRPKVILEGELETLRAGCVIAFFHSPWDRLLIRWAISRSFALILAAESAASLLGSVYVGQDRSGLRRVVSHLRAGGRAAIAMDSFVERGGLAARFLGARVRVLAGAVRVAAAAQVPVIPIATSYARGGVTVRFGPEIRIGTGATAEGSAARALLGFFERTLRDEPAAWSGLLSFLRVCRPARVQLCGVSKAGAVLPVSAP